MTDDAILIGRDEIAFRLELTPPELKVVYHALHSYLDDFGHEQADIIALTKQVLAKLPEGSTLT